MPANIKTNNKAIIEDKKQWMELINYILKREVNYIFGEYKIARLAYGV